MIVGFVLIIAIFTVCLFCIRLSGKKLPAKISVKIRLFGIRIEFDLYFTSHTDDKERGPASITGDDSLWSEVEHARTRRRRWFTWRRRGKQTGREPPRANK